MFSSSVSITIAEEIGREAWQAAQQWATVLIEMPAPKEWREGITSKAVSIFSNELQPIAGGRIDDEICIAIGKVLGICYLGDYALENNLSFNVASAASAVACCAVSSGVEERIAAMLVKRMISFYYYEKATRTIGIFTDLWRNMRLRYKLKSADICLLQRMAMGEHLIGMPRAPEVLDSASAALDVVDDAKDLTEDMLFMNGNPFVAIRQDPRRLTTVFEWCVSPHMESMKNALRTGDLPRFINEYVLRSIERVRACHLSLCVSL